MRRKSIRMIHEKLTIGDFLRGVSVPRKENTRMKSVRMEAIKTSTKKMLIEIRDTGMISTVMNAI